MLRAVTYSEQHWLYTCYIYVRVCRVALAISRGATHAIP